MSRAADRTQFTPEQRIILLEQDIDQHENNFAALDKRLARIQGVLVGILVSVTTASIMLAVNLVAKP